MDILEGRLSDESMDILEDIFKKYDISLRWLGRKYIREMSEFLFFNTSCLKSLNKKAYPYIAAKNKTRPANVEKSIRNALAKSNYRGTNKSFIAEVMERLQRRR